MASKEVKNGLITQFRERAGQTHLMVVAEYKGLSVAKLTALRRDLHGKGAEFSIYKNTLAKIAIRDTQAQLLEKDFKGAVGVLFVQNQNPIGALKAFVEYAKSNPSFSIKAGIFEGQRMELDALTDLSRVPDRATLYAQLLGLLTSPLAKTTQGLNQIVQKLVYGLSEYSKKKE